jgi:hypothetical protein
MVDTVGAREAQGSSSPTAAQPVTRDAAPRTRWPGTSVLSAANRAFVRVVWAVVAIVDAILLLDFVFRLIGAKDDGVAHAVFAFGSTLASPFDGIFANVGPIGGYVLRWSDLVVVFLCTLAGFVITRLFRLVQQRRRTIA